MWALSTRGRRPKSAALALAERPALECDGDPEELAEEIERLSERNRANPTAEQERMLLHLRNQLGIRLLDAEPTDPGYADPDFDALPDQGGLPEIEPADLTPGLLRAGILRDGCVLVRGLVCAEGSAGLRQADRPRVHRAGAPRRRPLVQRPLLPALRARSASWRATAARVDQGRRRRSRGRFAQLSFADG